ncbi:MAG: hypothetical protein ABR568_23730, partial [Pyrinomonadaceae bacterium]
MLNRLHHQARRQAETGGLAFPALSLALVLLLPFLPGADARAHAQQPSPTPGPQRTGRSYTIDNLPKTPPPPGPKAPAPMTFADITAQT